jgi:hypothetical protein
VALRGSETGMFDVRSSGSVAGSGGAPALVNVDILVDGVAISPVQKGAYHTFATSYAVERVVGPLTAGRHTVSVSVQAGYPAGSGIGTVTTTLDGWTLVAEQANATP